MQDPDWAYDDRKGEYTTLDIRAVVITKKTDQMMSDDYWFGQIIKEAIAQHPAHAGVVLRKALSTGNITDILEADSFLRRAAECLAEEQWHLENRVAA